MFVTVSFRDEDHVGDEVEVECTDIALDLGQALIDHFEDDYGREIDTDGSDFWYTDEDGRQVIVAHGVEVIETR